MIKNQFATVLFTSAICFGLSNQVNAAITTYTNRSLWEAAVASAGLNLSVTENFDTLVGQDFREASTIGGTGSVTLDINSVGLSFTHPGTTALADDNIILAAGSTSSVNIFGSSYARIDDNVGQNLLMSKLVSSADISALAFDYSGYGGGTEGITSNLGSIITVLPEQNVVASSTPLFFGFIDTDPSNVYTSFSSTGSDGAWGIDNLATATAIPEPSSFLLMSLSACGLLFSRSRKS